MTAPGAWQRSGLTGIVSGVSMSEALARVPAGVDCEAVRELIAAGEGGIVRAAAAAAEAAEAAAGDPPRR